MHIITKFKFTEKWFKVIPRIRGRVIPKCLQEFTINSKLTSKTLLNELGRIVKPVCNGQTSRGIRGSNEGLDVKSSNGRTCACRNQNNRWRLVSLTLSGQGLFDSITGKISPTVRQIIKAQLVQLKQKIANPLMIDDAEIRCHLKHYLTLNWMNLSLYTDDILVYHKIFSTFIHQLI